MTKRVAAGTENGFTLIELIVAVALLGMLTMTLFAGIGFGTRAWNAAQHESATLTRISLAQIALNDLLERSFPLMIRSVAENARVDFNGTANSIAFLIPAPVEIAPGGLARVTLTLEPHDAGFVLIYTAEPERAVGAPSLRRVLLRDIDTMAFSYFGADDKDQPAKWESTWQNRAHLPKLIRIQGTLMRMARATWPVLTVRPHVTADASCVFDPLVKDCRG
jgi:general secretion pathway protein J